MKGTRLLSRRQLNGYRAALSLSLPVVCAMTAQLSGASAHPTDATSNAPGRTVKFPDNTVVPALGQGSARLAQGRHPESAEEEALRTGISLGMSLIDTAEIHGGGKAERLISHAIVGQREHVFLYESALVWMGHHATDYKA